MRSGAQTRIRTTDTRIFNPLLYQLSYLGTFGCQAGKPFRRVGFRWKRVGYNTKNPAVQHQLTNFSPFFCLLHRAKMNAFLMGLQTGFVLYD